MRLFIFTFLAVALCLQATADIRSSSSNARGAENSSDMLFLSEDTFCGVPFIILKINRDAAYVSMADSALPSIDDPSIALCVGAAFTGELLSEFRSTNIAGDYVINGVFRRGYDCDANTGFLYADRGIFTIASLTHLAEWTDKAVKNKGTLFEQMMIIHNGRNTYPGKPIKPNVSDIYRSACLMNDGNLAVIQSTDSLPLEDYISSLIKAGVCDALYLDMGRGWNYGWYREREDAGATLLFDYRTPYQTNWLVIRKK